MTVQEAIEGLIYMIGDNCTDTQSDFIDEVEMAISALEKQIPKKPIGTYTDYKCPVCGRRVRSGKGSSSIGKRDNFCQRCGQALDWSDTE